MGEKQNDISWGLNVSNVEIHVHFFCFIVWPDDSPQLLFLLVRKSAAVRKISCWRLLVVFVVVYTQWEICLQHTRQDCS